MNAALQQQFSNSKQRKGTRPPTILPVGHVAFQARSRAYKPLSVGVSEEQMHAFLLLFPLGTCVVWPVALVLGLSIFVITTRVFSEVNSLEFLLTAPLEAKW